MVDVSLLESFPFLTSFYGNGGTKFPKTSCGRAGDAPRSARNLVRSHTAGNGDLAIARYTTVVIAPPPNQSPPIAYPGRRFTRPNFVNDTD